MVGRRDGERGRLRVARRRRERALECGDWSPLSARRLVAAENQRGPASFCTAVAERSGDTAFEHTRRLKRRRGFGRHAPHAFFAIQFLPAFAAASCCTKRRQIQSGIIPPTPNAQSINRQPIGIPRTPPMSSANGTTSTHAIIPNSITQIFFTGSRSGPRNASAMTKCPNASQSVP